MKTISWVLSSIGLMLFSFNVGFAADVIDGSLQMRLNFDAAPVNNVIVDTSPAAAHPGTNFAATWSSSENGRSGVMDFKAPNFNRITVPAIPVLNSTQGTICFWIKTPPNNAIQGNYAAILLDRRTSEGDVITITDDGTIFVQAQTNYSGANSFAASKVVTDNAWHHIAYVYDQSDTGSISIYVDGVLDTSQANSQGWSWPATQPIELGRSEDPYWRVYIGLMDDFQIHNRMLSAAEIAATFAGTPVLDSSLVERLNFDAAPVNNVIVDSSPSNNSANNNGPTWVSADTGRSGLMRFDPGYNQITVAAAPEFNSTTGTIAFWMKSSGNTGPGDFASMLFDRRTGSGDVITMKDDGTIFVQPYGGGNSFATQDSVNDGLWHHVAYVYDQSDTGYIQVYVDGAISGSSSNSATWAWPADDQIELGLSHDAYWFGFQGSLDEVRFYNRPLSAAEVAIIAPPSFRFSTKPASQTDFVGDDVLFTGLANMTATYQWIFQGTNLSGATSTSLALTNVQVSDAGVYALVASNASFGAITSTPPAVLTLNPRPPLAQSLVARYNFDAAPVNNVIVDTAPGSKHPGTNALATWTASVAGRSGVMLFSPADPESQIVVPPYPDFNSSKGTIAFWMKLPGNELTFGNFASIIFERRTGDGDVITMVDDGTLFVQAYSHYFHVNQFATTNTLNDDQWHHVAYIYDQGVNGFIRFYVDGQFAASNPNAGPWSWDPAEEIELGMSHDTYWRRFNGYLDDVQFYNRILNAAEVLQSMTLGPSISFSRAGNQLTLSWPQTGPTFVLQENSDLTNPLGWSNVPGGNSSPVILTISTAGNSYYRLVKQ